MIEIGPRPNFQIARNAARVMTPARNALFRFRNCGLTSDQMLDHIMPATAAMVPPTPAMTQALVRHDS